MLSSKTWVIAWTTAQTAVVIAAQPAPAAEVSVPSTANVFAITSMASYGLNMPDELSKTRIHVQPNGLVTWSDNATTGGKPYRSVVMPAERVQAFLGSLARDIDPNDPILTKGRLASDSAYTMIHAKLGESDLRIGSMHEQFEAQPNREFRDWRNMPMPKDTTLFQYIERKGAEELYFRFAWSEITLRASRFLRGAATISDSAALSSTMPSAARVAGVRAIERPIANAEGVFAIWALNERRGGYGPPRRLVLGIWPDGHAAWSGNLVEGGLPYYSAELPKEAVAALLDGLARDVKNDALLQKDRYAIDSGFAQLQFIRGKQRLSIRTSHEIRESQRTPEMISLAGEKLFTMLSKQPADELYFRFAWSEMQLRAVRLIQNAPSRPVLGELLSTGGEMVWSER